MSEWWRALGLACRSLTDLRIWAYLVSPMLVSLAVVVGLALWSLASWIGWLEETPPLLWLASGSFPWLAHLLAWLIGWLVLLSSAYVLGTLIAGIWVAPALLDHLAAGEYADLARLGRAGFAASLANSLLALGGLALGWVITLPLWLLPGGAWVLSWFWLAWFNRRVFVFDCLAAHATPEEMAYLSANHRGRLLALGALPVALAHVPLLGLIAPSFAALVFVHYCLQSLRGLRGDAVVRY